MGSVALMDLARRRFLELPYGVQQWVLRALGRRAPWDPGFDFRAPAVPDGLQAGPPDFVGIGVQKAGTTWWASLIDAHPGVYAHPCFHKELHYFDRFWAEPFTEDHVPGYHAWFPRPPGKRTGCWTPDYLHQHWVAPLLHAAAPEARLLVLVRDPVERYVSGVTHDVSRGDRRPAVAAVAFGRGFCTAALERYERYFGRDRLLVLQYEACREAPESALAETFAFLGLEPWSPPSVAEPVNPTRVAKVTLGDSERRELVARYRDEVLALGERYPSVDLKRWPNFRDVA
ncbi:MAG: sulfotransferase family protein [Acidimicrobiales bacterium]